MIRAPVTGTRISSQPKWLPAGETSIALQRPKKNRFVKRPISLSRANATKALTRPIKMAIPEMVIMRGVAVKSPSLSVMFPYWRARIACKAAASAVDLEGGGTRTRRAGAGHLSERPGALPQGAGTIRPAGQRFDGAGDGWPGGLSALLLCGAGSRRNRLGPFWSGLHQLFHRAAGHAADGRGSVGSDCAQLPDAGANHARSCPPQLRGQASGGGRRARPSPADDGFWKLEGRGHVRRRRPEQQRQRQPLPCRPRPGGQTWRKRIPGNRGLRQDRLHVEQWRPYGLFARGGGRLRKWRLQTDSHLERRRDRLWRAQLLLGPASPARLAGHVLRTLRRKRS